MDGGAWEATVHGVVKSWTRLSDFTSLHFTSRQNKVYYNTLTKFVSKEGSLQSLSRLRLFVTPPGSSVHGILQARILEWVAISFSKGSSQPRD